VIVSPPEIREILAATGMEWDDAVEPYPEVVDCGDGRRYTFDWCIRRRKGACIFLDGGRCTIYEHRPWICRTYPFMLDEGRLTVSACRGVGAPLSDEEAFSAARALIARFEAEWIEERAIAAAFRAADVPAGRLIVFDSDGMKVLDG